MGAWGWDSRDSLKLCGLEKSPLNGGMETVQTVAVRQAANDADEEI